MISRNARSWLVATTLLGVATAGCASGGGGKLTLNPRKGSLKESLSRLEHRNNELQRELADARDETKRLANELELAEIRNNDLATRLDSFRGGSRTASGAGGNSLSSLPDPDLDSGGTTRPAGRAPYKPPFTQIPNRIEVPDPPRSFDGNEAARPLLSPPPVEYYDFSASGSDSGRTRSSSSSANRPSSSGNPSWAPVGQGSSSGRR